MVLLRVGAAVDGRVDQRRDDGHLARARRVPQQAVGRLPFPALRVLVGVVEHRREALDVLGRLPDLCESNSVAPTARRRDVPHGA